MSPDGKYAASVAPMGEDGNRGIVIFDLETQKIHRSFDGGRKQINSVTWTTNEDVAFKVSQWGVYTAGMFSVNVNRKKIYQLLSNDVSARFVDPIPDEPRAWIWINGGNDALQGLVSLKTTGNARQVTSTGVTQVSPTGSNRLLSKRVTEPNGEIYGWGIDRNHEPRIVSRYFQKKLEYLHRYNRDEEWEPLQLDPEHWSIELFGADKETLYIAGYNGESTKGLYTYNIETNEIGDLLFRDDYYDFSDSSAYLFFKDQMVGFRYNADVPRFVWLFTEMEGIQTMIDGALKNRVNVIRDSSEDFSRHLIYSYSDKAPPAYSVLDLKEKTLKEITQSAPWLDYDKIAPTQVFHFKTSDGLRLEGYLTRPLGKEAPYPTITLVHGGPWARDNRGYDDETQFFASKGYAVVRVNYRGSTGFGKKISHDSDYHFRKMQDDITEAAQTMVKHGIADPDRLAIMGASFGGYSAMCGAVFEPDLYKCAITNMGVFDWEEMIKSRKRQEHKYAADKLLEELGDPKRNQSLFEEISPIYHVDKIKIPVFVIHGKDDSNVSIKQSKLLKSELESKMLNSELEKHGVEHETLFLSGEGHNIFSLENRVKTYEQVLAFLDKHMQ